MNHIDDDEWVKTDPFDDASWNAQLRELAIELDIVLVELRRDMIHGLRAEGLSERRTYELVGAAEQRVRRLWHDANAKARSGASRRTMH